MTTVTMLSQLRIIVQHAKNPIAYDDLAALLGLNKRGLYSLIARIRDNGYEVWTMTKGNGTSYIWCTDKSIPSTNAYFDMLEVLKNDWFSVEELMALFDLSKTTINKYLNKAKLTHKFNTYSEGRVKYHRIV